LSKTIPKRVLEDIRFRSDIVDVIGSYFNLQKAGSAFKATCPFHKEKTPSFHVNPTRQIFHCFGCGKGGDVFRFVMEYEGVDFVGAIKILAHKAGIAIELEEGDAGDSDKAALYQLHADVSAFFHKELLEGKSAGIARQYLAKRDLTPDTVEEFQIGFAPDGWDTLINWAHQNKFSNDLLEKAGLIVRKDKPESGRDYYDRFRNRLMFPIFDEQSRTIGFSGRIMDDTDKTAKYVNSPETLLFKKSRVLYALDKARRHIVESREAIICEGQIDVIRCHQAGFKAAVASQGTAFTEEHVRTLKRYADSVVLVFDTDKAGQDATIRTAVEFMDAGMAVRAGILPGNEDPDSFIRKNGAGGFKAVIDQAVSAVAYQIRVLAKREDAKSEIGAMRIAKSVLQTISHSPNAVQRAKLIQEAAERLNLPATALQDDLRFLLRNVRQQGPAGNVQENEQSSQKKEQPKEELQLCEHMANITDCPEIGEIVKKYLPTSMILDRMCRSFVEACLESAAAGHSIQDIINDAEDKSGELQNFAARMFMAPTKISGQETSHREAVKDIVLYIWRRKLEHERTEIARNPDSKNEERRRQITYDLKSLRRWDDGAPIIEFELSS